MKRQIAIYTLSVLSTLLLLVSCGGGGGGGGGEPGLSSLTYTGSTTPAVLNSQNALQLTELAGMGAYGMSNIVPAISFPRATLKAASLLPKARAQKQITDTFSEAGTCGGKMDISIVLDDVTLAYTADIVATDFCVDQEVMNGLLTSTGQFDQSGALVDYTVNFGVVTIRSDQFDYTISGSVSEIIALPNPSLQFSLIIKDNPAGKTYRYSNYTFTTAFVNGGFTETIAGRFYHSDHGYVDVSTLSPLTYLGNDSTPSSGTLVCAGSGNRKTRFDALSDAAYSTSGDLDGDGVFNDLTTGVVHYAGMNNLPEILAGADREGNVGCGTIAIDDATAADTDTDPLSIAWTFFSKPNGSTSSISGASTLSPTFSPDQPGDYTLTLTVSDGVGTPVSDTVKISVYGDLFCLNQKQFIPAAPLSKPMAVAAGDVTGDGIKDIVFVTGTYNTLNSDPAQDYHLYVFQQDSGGNFLPPVTYPAGDGESVAIADFNRDGRLDVAVSAETGVGILYQNGNGGLLPVSITPFGETVGLYEPNEIIAADFTGDGRTDIVSAYSDFTAVKIRLYQQAVLGGLDQPVLQTAEPGQWRLAAADVDEDQDSDLILTTGNRGKGSVSMGAFARVLKQENQTLGAPMAYLDDQASNPNIFCSDSFAAGGLGSGGSFNLAASCIEDIAGDYPLLRIYPEAGGLGTTPTKISAASKYSQLEKAELTGDSKDDLVGLLTGNQMAVDVYRQGASGVMPAETYPTGMPNYNYSPHASHVADLNGDGYPEIVAAVYVGPDGGTGLLILPGNTNRK